MPRGYYNRTPRRDETGSVYGSLTVVGPYRGNEYADPRAYWECMCKCGALVAVTGSRLRSGQVTSCGCEIPPGVGGHRIKRIDR